MINIKLHNIRLHPGDDVKQTLKAFTEREQISAASIVSAVGSLARTHMRFADAQVGTVLEGSCEVVSLSGTLSKHGMHIHLAVADSEGRVRGGHLLDGCQVHTTLELVILEQKDVEFFRVVDPTTNYLEWVIQPK